MRLIDELWRKAEKIYSEILKLPFIEELMKGILPEEKFIFYMQQDTLYLNEFSKALALAGVRSSEQKHFREFLELASAGVEAERRIHDTYFNRYGINADVPMAPACFTYSHYLLSIAFCGSYGKCVGALLPCFWIYREVGLYMLKSLTESNPYGEWIRAYSGEEFSLCVDRALAMAEEIAGSLSKKEFEDMGDGFIKASRLEWMFWDSAYRLEKWQPAVK